MYKQIRTKDLKQKKERTQHKCLHVNIVWFGSSWNITTITITLRAYKSRCMMGHQWRCHTLWYKHCQQGHLGTKTIIVSVKWTSLHKLCPSGTVVFSWQGWPRYKLRKRLWRNSSEACVGKAAQSHCSESFWQNSALDTLLPRTSTRPFISKYCISWYSDKRKISHVVWLSALASSEKCLRSGAFEIDGRLLPRSLGGGTGAAYQKTYMILLHKFHGRRQPVMHFLLF